MPELWGGREGRCDSRGNCSSSGLALLPGSLDTFHPFKGIRRGARDSVPLPNALCLMLKHLLLRHPLVLGVRLR